MTAPSAVVLRRVARAVEWEHDLHQWAHQPLGRRVAYLINSICRQTRSPDDKTTVTLAAWDGDGEVSEGPADRVVARTLPEAPMTRFYVAARFSRQDEARAAAEEITEATGWDCTASWLDATPKDDKRAHDLRHLGMTAASACLADIDDADLVFALTEDLTPPVTFARDINGNEFLHMVPAGHARGGRHVEIGYAIARQKPILLIGPRENIFHSIASQHDTVDVAIRMARLIIITEEEQ